MLLHTGGTLGMRPRQPDQALAPDEFGSTVLEYVPELNELADIEPRVLFNLDSTDLGPVHWKALARAVFEARDQCDGVVISHGTDALSYTAAALSFLLRNLPFPVVLTASQRPLADIHTDGRANLVGAVDLACSNIREVSVYFSGLLFRGNRVVKRSTFAFGAFHSPNFPPLAEIGTEIRISGKSLVAQGEFECSGDFDARLAVVWLQPGNDGGVLRALLETDVFGVLLVAPGMGNVPVEDTAVADAIRALVGSGRIVAMATQSASGNVDLTRYVGGRLAASSGAVGIGDMTLEAASVKLMFLAGSFAPATIAARLLEPIAGEVTPP